MLLLRGGAGLAPSCSSRDGLSCAPGSPCRGRGLGAVQDVDARWSKSLGCASCSSQGDGSKASVLLGSCCVKPVTGATPGVNEAWV